MTISVISYPLESMSKLSGAHKELIGASYGAQKGAHEGSHRFACRGTSRGAHKGLVGVHRGLIAHKGACRVVIGDQDVILVDNC